MKHMFIKFIIKCKEDRLEYNRMNDKEKDKTFDDINKLPILSEDLFDNIMTEYISNFMKKILIASCISSTGKINIFLEDLDYIIYKINLLEILHMDVVSYL